MKSFRILLSSLLFAGSVFAAAPSNPILYVTQVPLPDEYILPSTGAAHTIKNERMSIVSAMQVPLGDTEHAGRGGALWIRYPSALNATNPRNLTAAAGYGGAVDPNSNATNFQGANSIAVQHPHVHWNGAKAVFSMVVGAPTSAADTTQFRWQLYEITNFAAGQTPVITYVAGQPANYNNMQACYDTQDRLIFVSDAPHGMMASIYPQLDQYNALPCNTGLWRLDRTKTPAEVKQIIHTPSGAFTPFVDSTGRVMFVQWDHLSRDVFASYDREVIGTTPQSFNGNGTFDSETGSIFTRGTAGTIGTSNYTTFNFFPEPRNFDVPALTALGTYFNGTATVPILNGLAVNQFFPWECREDGSEHETDRHVGRHELGGTAPLRASFKDDANLLTATFSHPTALNFFHLTESPTSPGTSYGINSSEAGTHTSGPIVSYVSSAAVNPANMAPTYVTPGLPGTPQPWTTQDVYRSPVPLANGSLLAVHSTMTQNDTNTGTAAAPRSNFAFRLRALTSNGTNMIPDSTITFTNPQNVTNIQYYAYGALVTYDAAKLWELDPVEVVSRNRPAQLTSPIAAVEQSVFDEEKVHAPTYQNYLRTNNLALVTGRDVTRRDAADKQQPYNLKVSWSATQTLGAVIPSVPQKIYDVGWMQIFQADAIRAYTHDGTNPAALPAPGRRLMPVPLHGQPLSEMPVTPGAPAGAVKIADDGSWAAVLPAGRSLTWHMLDGTGAKSQVKERVEVTFAPGEVRTCAVCHGVNSLDQAGNLGVPSNKPAALRPLLQFWRGNHPPGTVQHTAPTATVLKNAGSVTLNVSRIGGNTGPISVNFTTVNGTALAGTDYSTTSNTLTWADGDTAPKPITIPLANNPAIGANKTLTVALSAPLYGDLGATTVNTLTIAEPPFQSWQFAHFAAGANTPAIAGDNADPDGDGISNLIEYFQGTIPAAHADSAPQGITETIGGVPSLSLTFTRDPSRTDLTYTAEVSNDLAIWNPVADTLTGTTGALENRKASVPIGGPQKFLRLKVTRP